jgi:hypothetical protein
MGIENGRPAISSTSSMLHTSILLYTYTHFTYRRLPSIMSIKSSTVESSLNIRSALWILYSCMSSKGGAGGWNGPLEREAAPVAAAAAAISSSGGNAKQQQ